MTCDSFIPTSFKLWVVESKEGKFDSVWIEKENAQVHVDALNKIGEPLGIKNHYRVKPTQTKLGESMLGPYYSKIR